MNMKRISTFFLFCGIITAKAQTIPQQLANAIQKMEQHPQFAHATISLYVVESNTNKIIYAHNEQTGLAPASTQKIFTSIAAYELLGKGYAYNTPVSFTGNINNGVLHGNLMLKGMGDPTLGSWRYPQTNREAIVALIKTYLARQNIRQIDGDIIISNGSFAYQPLPGGWIWDDIGNYYGAGSYGFNWNENQYDLLLQPGKKVGDVVAITGTNPAVANFTINNHLSTGKAGSGDHGYIYLAPYTNTGFVTGTVPAGVVQFTLSGALPNPALQAGNELKEYFIAHNMPITGNVQVVNSTDSTGPNIGYLTSPRLDSMMYFFLQKSINLYGEAFIKTMAAQQTGEGSTENGVKLLQNFWQARGIDAYALHMQDGCGLSPQNRVTTYAMVSAMQYARNKDWFNSFYAALPLYNGTKMKSGTIGGAKAFTGYQTAKNGTVYTFAFIINNYNDAAGSVVPQMFKVLDILK
ncbi:D-alanyl-D-alanine carboxypeptidase/D-alanyl-D-alanine-endopeptidase [Panacibacter sp. KCS-6]|uniref:D-alanyl-D-alanine carboxypeptidase/D-alanyl-D-alanine-endopeptidase n=2 Tax=Limnovirga soli TaxID=2656915 RepID=A0A8J8FFP7_9BACT|nr:D-alanyl-D-alanine carboxypeptidase/D-alanyl-D-alanine-endopeptidase [Limnovirga soli]